MSDSHAASEKPGFTVDVMPIQTKLVSTLVGMMNQSELRFFRDNPRVYSIVREEGRDPSQDEIEEKLQEMDHVKALVQDIKKHGGLIDPLVVKTDTLEVVEGNSRLAAYRLLSKQNALKWAQVKVRLLPTDIDDRAIAALLAQWHLRGKKEWPPYEQAGYLYRRHHDQDIPFKLLSAEVGVSSARAEKIVEAYSLMVEHGDTKRDRWSYYDEFVKSRKIAKVCETHPSFKARVLSMIKDGDFARAQNVRDDLPVICAGPPKNLAKFASGKLDFDEALERAKESGGDSSPYQKVRKFRVWLAEQETQDALNALEDGVKDRLEFEVKRLQKLLDSILKSGIGVGSNR